MALIKCPECEKEISDKAPTCPYCGCPTSLSDNKEQEQVSDPPKKKKKKAWIFIVIILFIFGFISCIGGGEDSTENDYSEAEEVVEYVSNDEIDNVFANPSEYTGKYIKLSGKIFSDPDVEDDRISFQMFSDVENSEDNTYVVYKSDNSKDVKDYKYVIVDGKIKGESSGTNAFGGVIHALKIEAVSVQESNYIDIVVPTIKEIPVDSTIDQYGYSVTIDKIELAEKETRIYLSVSNNGSENFSIYSWNTKIVQDGKQYENQSNYDYEYDELQTDLLVGVSSSGMLFFPALDPEKPFTIYLDGSSDNWNEDIETYTFEIANK